MKRFLQKTALLLLCLALLAGFSPFAEARDTLRVGIHPLGDGVITVDATGNYYGIETDYMQTLTSYAGMDVAFVPGSWEENLARLRTGEIDAIAGVPQMPEYRGELLYSRMPIDFARGNRKVQLPVPDHQVTPLYYVMRQGNDALFGRIERANDAMAANRPFFLEMLTQMYADRQPARVLRLTQDERGYLAAHPVIHAVVVPNERPIAYMDEDGAFKGKVKMLTDRIAEDLGVTIDIRTVPSYVEAEAAIADGSADGRAWYFIVFGIANLDAIVGTYGQQVVSDMIRRFTAELSEVSWAKACASHASAGHVLCLAQAKDEGILIEAVHHQKEVQEYVRVGDMNVHVPIHAGIAAVGFPPEERRKIFEHANLAMHETNDVQVYNDAMQASALERSQIESLQQAALDREEFVIWYQPKYDLKKKMAMQYVLHLRAIEGIMRIWK